MSGGHWARSGWGHGTLRTPRGRSDVQLFRWICIALVDLQAFIVPAMFLRQIDDLYLRSLMAEDGYLFRAVVAEYCILQTHFILRIS